ncbi:MAG: dihydrolipoamide acetyltransferase family protein [Candidatus Rhabdochlamydia sp.]
MPFTLTMPKLSPTMEEGVIVKWCKQEGDFTQVGDTLFEIATDKATVEHSSLDEGYLRQILIPQGSSAFVNQAVAIFTETKEESIEGYIPTGISPTIQKSVSEVSSDTLNPVKEQKTTPVSSLAALTQPLFKPEEPLTNYQFNSHKGSQSAHLAASPLAKKLAKSKGIDLSTVKGSGPLNRILSRDLELGQPDLPVTFSRNESPKEVPGAFEEEGLTPMRKTIASRLQAAKTFIPHFYVSIEIRCEKLLAIKEQLKAVGLKVSVNDLIMRSAALTLREHPKVNSGFDSEQNKIIRFKTIDIAVAVSIPDGLITPIIRHADFKNIGELSKELRRLALLAKEGKLSREEYMGGSFTLSNLGMYDVSDFIAVINPPQAAILAISSILDKAVVENQLVVPGKVMTLTLSADHRVIDGVDAALFLKTLKKYLENPASLLI